MLYFNIIKLLNIFTVKNVLEIQVIKFIPVLIVCVSERKPILLVVDPFFFSHIVWSCGFDTVWFTVNMKFASML